MTNCLLLFFPIDGVVSYRVPQGYFKNSDIDLTDATYDGGQIGKAGGGREGAGTRLDVHYLDGGIGQLADGATGHSNFRVSQKTRGTKGYEWIGWNRLDFRLGLVEIVFRFDRLRLFRFVSLHTNNMFSQGVTIFRSAKIFFSRGGMGYALADVVDFKTSVDKLSEEARFVTIPLQGRKGDQVKVELHFYSDWILISEAQFDSGKYLLYNSFYTLIVLCWLSEASKRLLCHRFDDFASDDID